MAARSPATNSGSSGDTASSSSTATIGGDERGLLPPGIDGGDPPPAPPPFPSQVVVPDDQMWDAASTAAGTAQPAAAASDCDCAGPPPEFLLPPPPRPPFLQNEFYTRCNEDPIPEIETCDALPVSPTDSAMKTVRPRAILRMKEKELLTRDGLYDSKDLDIEMQYQMKKCINHLQTIMKMCDDLEHIYSYLTLTQVLATLFIVCTCLFLVSTTPVASSKFVNELVYLGAMGFQLVLYCWFGNEIFLKSSGLPLAIYEGDWLSSSMQYRRLMLITMTRMVKPLRLTAGKFAPLTLNTFVTILRGSYSFFAVLKNVENEE